MIAATEHETVAARRERDRRLSSALRLQTRAKWYNMARERRYKISGGSNGSSDNKEEDNVKMEDAATVAAQNEMVKEALDRLGMDFPHLREALVRIGDLM